jgi:hypothetical protein
MRDLGSQNCKCGFKPTKCKKRILCQSNERRIVNADVSIRSVGLPDIVMAGFNPAQECKAKKRAVGSAHSMANMTAL